MLKQELMLERLELERIAQAVQRRYGLEFRHCQLKLLEDAVKQRCKENGDCGLAQYQDRLQCEEESLALVQLLTVHETYFFREAAQFEVMKQALRHRLDSGATKPVLRLLSAGCSTGEEAYSMAIAALTLPGAGREWDFEVVGVDVDPAAIRKAKSGTYGMYSFRGCSNALRSRYFQPTAADRFAISEEVKAKVRFETLNLFATDYPHWMNEVDVVFYRNVSIYFSQMQRAQIFNRLASLLTTDGCMFVSCTETLYHAAKRMELVNCGDVFYYRNCVGANVNSLSDRFAKPAQAPRLPAARRKASAERRIAKPKPGRSLQAEAVRAEPETDLFSRAMEFVRDKQYDEALICLDRLMEKEPLCVKGYTLKANLLLNRQRCDEAIELCRTALVMDVFCLEAYLLLGIAERNADKWETAIQRFKEAVYVAPDCWLAHFFLAELYRARNENGYAAREYQVAMRILQRGGFERHGLSLFLLPVSLDDVIRVCSKQIDALDGA